MWTVIVGCVLVGCQADDSTSEGVAQPRVVRVVAAFDSLESLEACRERTFEGMTVVEVRPGFRRIATIVEIDLKTRLSQQDALKLLRTVPGVLSATSVRKHRYSIVVEFTDAVDVSTASKRLSGLGVLWVRIPGKRDKSPYVEVICESDDPFEKLAPRFQKAPMVVVAELSLEYKAESGRD